MGDNKGLHHSTTCYTYAIAKEFEGQRATNVCGGGDKIRHVVTSISNRIEVRILQRSADRRSYFMIHFESE